MAKKTKIRTAVSDDYTPEGYRTSMVDHVLVLDAAQPVVAPKSEKEFLVWLNEK